MTVTVERKDGQSYLLEPPPGMGGRQLEEYIRGELESLHPGFSSRSLWDWHWTRREGKRLVLAAVVGHKVFLQGRLESAGSALLVQGEDGVEGVFFSPLKFSRDGRRRRPARMVAGLAVLILCAVLLWGVWRTGERGEVERQRELESTRPTIQEPLRVQDALERIRHLASAMQREGGRLQSIAMSQDGVVRLAVQGIAAGQLQALVQELEPEGRVGFGTMEHGSLGTSMEATIQSGMMIPPPSTPSEMVEAHDQLLEFLGGRGLKALSSGVGAGTLWLELAASRGQLDTLEQELPSYLAAKGLLVCGLSLQRMEDGTAALVWLEVQVEDGGMEALHGGPEGMALAAALALVEPPPPAAKAKPQPATVQRQEPPTGSVELGRVEKDGRMTRYYRSPEGRVMAIEEEK